jgi:hypothetical protein
MLINPTNGSFYFTLFYILAFLATFIILISEGYKRKIPIISWVLLLIFSKIRTFISAYFPLNKSLLIEPFFVFQNSEVSHFAIGLHYKLSSTSFYKNRR